ncbi:hypothetical protein [Escherichia coli]|uniref:hypothetical protein n=1 Tax=Escherichia coli TaxID=562 RepID=UPI0039A69048
MPKMTVAALTLSETHVYHDDSGRCGMHAFNGELFVQATWDTRPSRLFRTQFPDGQPRSASATRTIPATAGTAVPRVQINDKRCGRWILRQRGRVSWLDAAERWTWIPRELPGRSWLRSFTS